MFIRAFHQQCTLNINQLTFFWYSLKPSEEQNFWSELQCYLKLERFKPQTEWMTKRKFTSQTKATLLQRDLRLN
ncbi:CLUMA_CG013399, isoform A [Clunio marinus]|uniref:CLUMA_CG013399, isoform A n=1 Tax=Clunio marinus TaxID=568069 RepID=A0A1J1IIP9_9DIPT|nr:CLUMA_CG013399, isoform A [Clunio marinus]